VVLASLAGILGQGVFFFIHSNQGIYLGFGDLLDKGYQVTDGEVIHMVSQAHLGFHLVAIGYGHIVHVVAKAYNLHVPGILPGDCNPHPYGNPGVYILVFPMAYHYLAVLAHAGDDVSEFPVSMRALVEVHEVHVNGFPGNFFVKLSVQVQQGLLEILQPVNPHFGWREGMHPGDNTDALRICIGFAEGLGDFGRGVDCSLVHDFNRQVARFVEPFDHGVGMTVHGYHRIPSVQELRTGDKPNFEIAVIKCHYGMF